MFVFIIILFIFAPLGEQPEAAAGGREVQDRQPRETARGETEAYCRTRGKTEGMTSFQIGIIICNFLGSIRFEMQIM